jgi:hypothetical protein
MIIWLSQIVQSLLLEAALAGCRDDKGPDLLLRASRHHTQVITYSISKSSNALACAQVSWASLSDKC